MGSDLLCDRCVRPAPDDFDSELWDGGNYADESLLPRGWRLVNDGQFLAVACPGCLTPADARGASVPEPT